MPNVNYGQLNDLLGHLLRYAVNRGHGAFQEVFDQDEVTPLQFMIAELINENRGITHSEICKAMQTSASVVTTTLKPLLADGRVRRRDVNGDARKLAYELSPSGEDWYAGIKPKIALSEARLAEALTDDERTALIGMLKRLAGVET
ncbi:MarR family winged helix-turn-helix transcriptional regulator [Roseibium suaedae]|uniref:Transcriptional regulator, MarR family n=1 Tax=Roseibium suaedae TaxID=735517 RepID=A0A1M7HQ82_9HYPH|nr:MarR family transcriptional regulator [Roseibium suaedae]SHM30644.1 transcriptional regulator, MarR family [Roseibium suaedae]